MMKKLLSLLCLTALLCAGASAELVQNQYLDAAFPALEEGNPFAARYEEATGADITPLISIGIPYTFGGQDARYLFKVRKITQVSKYGAVGTKCVWGFDCSGFTRWIQQQVGDLLAAKHSGRHVLMYIGTLRDYGYDGESAGEAAAFLDYPLMINCGNDPNYITRTQQYIDENGLDAKPSKGGVTVSIVGMAETDAPHLNESGAKPFYYYELADGYHISSGARPQTSVARQKPNNGTAKGGLPFMKMMIASDIHGSALYCKRLLERFDREGCERLILLGDLLYHGPRNALPDGYDPPRVAEMLNERKDKLLCVRGNCDAEVDRMVLHFPIGADYAVMPLGSRLLYMTHGHLFHEADPLPLSDGDIYLFGHIHVPKCEEKGGVMRLNPGSVSIPKEESHRGCMTLENGLFTWKTLEGETFQTWQA